MSSTNVMKIWLHWSKWNSYLEHEWDVLENYYQRVIIMCSNMCNIIMCRVTVEVLWCAQRWQILNNTIRLASFHGVSVVAQRHPGCTRTFPSSGTGSTRWFVTKAWTRATTTPLTLWNRSTLPNSNELQPDN